MSLIGKFKKMLLGDSKPEKKIKVTEISNPKSKRNLKKETETNKNDRKSPKDFARKSNRPKGDKSSYSEESKPNRNKSESSHRGESSYKSESNYRSESNYKGDSSYKGESSYKGDSSYKSESKYGEGDAGGQGRKSFHKKDRFARNSNDNFRKGGRRQGGQRRDETDSSVNIGDVAVDFSNWSVDEFKIAPSEDKVRFHDLNIPEKVMRGIFEAGYEYCTPIQALILPEAFKSIDVSGKAQTGTGKTAAFLITIFKRLIEKPLGDGRANGTPRALIMAPTRELVIQIEKDARVLGKYCGFRFQSVFGGINYERQKRQLEDRKIDVLVATPGRLLDYQEQGVLDLSKVEILVIDEADRMLDMGFIPDMKKIIGMIPEKGVRQTMLFSATLTPDILRLASQWTKNPLSFEVDSKELTAEAIEQRAYVVTDREKFALMYNMIENENLNRVIVFGNRRDEVSKLTDMFRAAGISCGLLSGDVSQAKRIKTLEDLRSGKIRILCATDVAARGIHVDDVTHVFNFSLPDDPEDYVHRIGRTGRAGASGVSIIFATEEDAYVIPRIEKFTGHKLNYIHPDETLTTLPEEIAKIVPVMKSSHSRVRGAPKPQKKGFQKRGGGSFNKRGPRRRS